MYQNSDLLELEARIPSNSITPVFIPKMNHNSSANGRERNHNLTSYQLVGYYKEVFKQTMLNQEMIFKEQILELHRLYGRQRELMNGITRNESDKHNLGAEASRQTTLPQTSLVCTQKTSSIPACSQVSMSGAENIQSPSCFVQKRNIQACSYPVQTEGHSGDRGFLVPKYKSSKKNLDLRLPADTIYIDSEEEESLEDGTVPEAAEVSSYPTKRIPELVCNGGATNGFNSVSKYASSAVLVKKGLVDLNSLYKLEEEMAPASDSFGGPTAIEAYSRILLQSTEMKMEQLSSSNYNAGKTQSSFYSLPRGLYADNLSSSSNSLHKNLKQHEQLSCLHNYQNSSCERAIIGVQNFGKISGQPPSIISDHLMRVDDGLVSELNGVTRYLQDSANVNARKDIDLNFMPPSCSLDAAVSQSSQTTGTEKLEGSNEKFPLQIPKFNYYEKTDEGCEDSNQAEASNFLSERIHRSHTCETPNIDHCNHLSSSNHHQNSVQDVKNCNRAVLLDLNVPCESVHIQEVELTANERVENSKFEKDGGFGIHIDLNSSVSDVDFGVHIDLNASLNEDELPAISSPSTDSLFEAPASPENKECSPPRGVSSDENQADTPDQMSGPEAPENKESSLPTGESDENHVDKPFPVSVPEDFKHKVCSQRTESDEKVDTPCPSSVHKDFEHTVCCRPTESDEQIEKPSALSGQGGLQNKECSQPIESYENQIETPFPSALDDLECKDCSQPMDCDETQTDTPLLMSGQETKECSQAMDSTEKQVGTPVVVSGQEVYLEEELFRTAAECLVSIASSACHTCSERTTYELTQASSKTLRWFADLASSVLGSLDNKVGCGDHEEVLPDGMDYFEAMTLKLPETKVEEFCCYKSVGYKEEVMVTATSRCQPKKGRPRKGTQQRKEFRKENLTLSRCEVTEDLQVIGTLIEASADCSKTRSVRHAAKFGLTRGRRRCTISASTVTEKTAASPSNHIGIKRQLESDKRSLYDWGEVTRRRRGQRNQGSKV